MIDREVSRRVVHPDGAERLRPTLGMRVLGAIGAAVIAVTLFGARAWARITRAPYYRD